VQFPIENEYKRGTYEDEHGYEEGRGYVSDRDPNKTDGMFCYYSLSKKRNKI
jgi:hypothetical protein